MTEAEIMFSPAPIGTERRNKTVEDEYYILGYLYDIMFVTFVIQEDISSFHGERQNMQQNL
jgi:hypothetical protein